MALPTMAAPTRPAPIPKPRPLASTDWVVDAMLPVTASIASAAAAILVLIDMRNSIRFEAAIVACMTSWTGAVRIRFDHGAVTDYPSRSSRRSSRVADRVSALRMIREYAHIESIDVGKQLAERGGAVIQQLQAFLRRCLGSIAGGTAGMQVLRLPGEWRGPMRREPKIILLHRNTGRTKISDVL